MPVVLQDACDENIIRSGPSAAPCSKTRGRWILAATILASSMAFIDGTVVNVALPALQTNLNATAVDVQWVIESYALVVISISNRHIAETRDRESTRVDWFGALLTALGLGALVYGLIESSQVGFNDRSVTAALTAGVVVLILFLFAESRLSQPMLPLTLFRSRTFAGTNLLTFLLYAALGGTLFFLPL